MKFKLPYVYEIERKRADGSLETRPQVGLIEQEIKEVERSDISVVARWNSRSRRGQKLRNECVRVQGDLYLPVLSRTGDVVTREDLSFAGIQTMGNIDAICSLYGGAIVGDNRPYYLYEWYNGKKHKFAKPREGAVIASSYESEATYVRSMAEGLFIMNDQIWQKVTGVHCKIYEGRGNFGEKVVFGGVDFSKNDGENWDMEWSGRSFFPGEEFRIPLSDVVEGQRLGGEVVHHQFSDMEVFDYPALNFDARKRHLTELVVNFIGETGEDVARWKHVSRNAWLNLRNHLADPAANLEGMVQMLSDLQDKPVGPDVKRIINGALESWAVMNTLYERPIPELVDELPRFLR